ncbi:MAG TPA: type IV pilin protein [Casimicrobiaceae bacterium]|nr:type IV pilin protein [Casimicrobiaceae bacterium]
MLRTHCRTASPAHPPDGRERGFTLIEVIIAILIVGILLAIAVPQYTEYVRRSRIIDATSQLDDFRVRMEQYFQDNRTYQAVGGGGACGVADPGFTAGTSPFQILCTLASATGYTVNANGQAAKGMNGFQYRIIVSPAGFARDTVGVYGTWSLPSPNNCWAVRKDGSCS